MGLVFARSLFVLAVLSVAACQDIASNKSRNPGAAYLRAAPNIGLLMATGQIDEDFSDRLGKMLSRNPSIRVVEIESGGGWMSEARRAAGILNRNGISVRVRGRCASACASLWAASDRRELVEGARIGLHEGIYVHKRKAPRFLEGALQKHEANLRDFEVAALRHAGFSDALISRGEATPHESILWLSTEQLSGNGVRFSLIRRKSGPASPHKQPAP